MEDTATRIAALIKQGVVRFPAHPWDAAHKCPQCEEAPLLEPLVFNPRRRVDGVHICFSCRDFNLIHPNHNHKTGVKR